MGTLAAVQPRTYADIKRLFTKRWNGNYHRPVEYRNNTRAMYDTDTDTIEVFLHGHRLALMHPDGRVQVWSNGFLTYTTLVRINDLVEPIGWKVWRYTTADGTVRFTVRSNDGKVTDLAFTDSMTFYPRSSN